MIVGYLGHKMVVSVMIHNLSDTTGFTWSILDQHWGKASVLPDPKTNNTIPKMDYITDSFGDHSTVKVSYEASMQFIDSNDFGDIGLVLTLTPRTAGRLSPRLLRSLGRAQHHLDRGVDRERRADVGRPPAGP